LHLQFSAGLVISRIYIVLLYKSLVICMF
jgi:hypothetical protein